MAIIGLALAPFFAMATDTSDVTKSTKYTIPEGCGITIKDGGNSITCESWEGGSQATTMGANIATCLCSPKCMQAPPNHYYYNDPVKKTKQTDTNNITLPVILAWDNVTGWQKEDGGYLWYWSGASGKQTVSSKAFGIRSYVLEIDNSHNELRETKSAGNIFRRILKTTEFDPTNEFYPCFFNSDTTIKWRVRPCCKEDGSYCMPAENAEWWTFRTSPAPEPVWPKDPDWNGDGDAKNISFKDVKLKWCQARIDNSKKPYNDNQPLALSYQLRVYTNENQVVLTGQTIPAVFAKLAQWLQTDKPALKSPLACHYLEKQADNTCKPDVVNPVAPLKVRNSDSFYYWSHKDHPTLDRALFTENLTYYWQIRRCFNNPAAGTESCDINDKNGWGQLWAFTTKNETLNAPNGMVPPNDIVYADAQKARLTGMPGSLQWDVSSGANSFAYDIQKMNADGTAQSLVGNERRTTKSQIFFTKNNSGGQDSESQGFELELDTAYKWRAKSCWPSIPVGNVCDSTWSPWYYFRTTGRAPKIDSLTPAAAANNISLPVNLEWEAVPGAKSYIVTLNDEKIVTQSNNYSADYPKTNQSQIYSWKVQTCADNGGKLCSGETPEISFMTAALGSSQKPLDPANILDNSKLIFNFSWEPVTGAHYYKFVLNYTQKSGKETNAACAPGKKVERTVTENSLAVKKDIGQIYCLGKYEWSVLACLDQDCNDKGADPAVWSFDFVAGGKEIKEGEAILATCGLTNDNPNTEWDDREPCSVKHLLLTVMQALNMILFQVSFILLPILILATGAMYYFQFGGTELMERAKSWWRIIGIGYVLMFFAWAIVGIFLSLSGYGGVWWNI
ncbi:MAG: pilin [Candidatus Pacebacteria bacterium]|nr:pilin [Candidatus Paceibacterota bacterium]